MASEFRLNTAAPLQLQPGEKIEAEVQGVKGVKVLLANVAGTILATGSKCTHYGAPLVKGVLTQSGRLVCPWHGACFNASTGDVEDAPALDALAVYPVTQRDGAVFITADAEKLKSGRRVTGKCAAATADAGQVLVIGGGSGAMGVLEGLRSSSYCGAITVISKEGYLPIDRTKLSKQLAHDPAKLALHDRDWFDSAAVRFIDDEVIGVDLADRRVRTRANPEAGYLYSKLVLAVGCAPRRLDKLPGFAALGNILTLRTAHDARRIADAIAELKAPGSDATPKKNIVVIGSSFIGLELAVATCEKNSVVVVGMEKAPLSRVMGDHVGTGVQRLLESKGVTFYMDASVEKAEPSDTDPAAVGYVNLKDGTRLAADLVVLGVGVSPATEFLRGNDLLHLEDDGSVATDVNFQLPDHPDVFAIGDIATYPYHGPGGGGRPTRIEHWNVAQNAGRVAAAHIASPSYHSAPFPFVPVFWSALGSQLRYCGNNSLGWDQLILHGDPGKGDFAAYYCQGDVVVAAAAMGRDPLVSKVAVLMQHGKMPTRSEVDAGVDLLALPC